MKFKIATPERIMLETEIDSVSLPTSLGEITILPNHVPLVVTLVPGEIKYRVADKENFFVVSGGVIEVKRYTSDTTFKNSPIADFRKKTEVIVLADAAEFGHEIDLAKAEAARAEAKKLMSQPKDEKSFVDASVWLDRNQARIKVAKKHHTHKHQNTEN